VINLAVMLKL